MKKYVLSCCLFLLFSSIHAQYNIADTNYINTSILLNFKADSLILSNIDKYSLDVNHIFFFPKDSIRYVSSSSSSSSNNSSSYSSGGKPSIGKAIASVISAPFIALGKIFGGLSKAGSTSKSKNNPIQKDTAQRVIEVYPTTLMKEILDKGYYGKKAHIYRMLNQNNTLNFDQLDTFPQRRINEYANKLIAVSIFVDDTILLNQLYTKGLFHIDSSLYAVEMSIFNKPLLFAATTSNFKLLEFLMNHQVNPFIATRGFRSNFFSLGINSGVDYLSYSSKEMNIYKEVDVIKLSKNKDFVKVLKNYRKQYKKTYLTKK